MKERPILFSGSMVRAILEGRKTQTRRVIKPQPEWKGRHGMVSDGWSWDISPKCKLEGWRENEIGKKIAEYCPYGKPRAKLWVRETFANGPGDTFVYRADFDQSHWEASSVIEFKSGKLIPLKWRPSIHMPRWASRITLKITSVQVERLQEISQADAIAEGAPPSHRSIDKISQEYGFPDFSRSWYAQLWESINGKGSWAINPWVWVIEFKKVGLANENG